ERRVGDERADRVRDEERDLERVDGADGAEVVADDGLAQEADHPRDACGEGEDGRRPGEPAAPRLCGAGRAARLYHAASIGRGLAAAGTGTGLWYHRRAREVAGFASECRTSSNRRSAFVRPPRT